jgi:hypothetical protein
VHVLDPAATEVRLVVCGDEHVELFLAPLALAQQQAGLEQRKGSRHAVEQPTKGRVE